MTAGRRLGRALVAGCAVVSLACGVEGPPVSPTSSQLLSELGDYQVVPLGAPPVTGTVSVADVTEDLLVVGSIMSGSASRAFAWKAGEFFLLSNGSASASSATDVNDKGEILGLAGEPVVWSSMFAEPAAVLPASSPYRSAMPVALGNSGRILLQATAGIVLQPVTHAVEATFDYVFLRLLGSADEVVGVDIRNYSTLMIWNPDGTVRCSWWVHGAANPMSVNGKGDVLAQMSSTSERYDRSDIFEMSTCTRIAAFSVSGNPNDPHLELKSMNDGRLAAGLVAGRPSIMRWNAAGYVPIDTLLARSSGDSPSWRVSGVGKLTNSGVLLATASRSGQTPEPVLLIPRNQVP